MNDIFCNGKERTGSRSRTFWRWAGALCIPAALSVLFQLLHNKRAVMNFWVFHVMGPGERLLGRLWSRVPVSVMEWLIALFLAGNLVWLVRAVAGLVRRRGLGRFFRRLLALGAAWLWLWCAFCWMWRAAYYADTFARRSGLSDRACSVEELAAVTRYFAQNAARLAGQVPRDGEGHFAADRETVFQTGPEVYENLTREFPCLAMDSVRAKPIFFSRLQSRLGFTGMYFPFTGEANVNVDAPVCLLPATVAHEMAHQRMVASEQEANFVGILAAVTSGDPVYQYSGYLMGLIQLCNALYEVAPQTWTAIAQSTFTAELSQDWQDNNQYWAAMRSPVEDRAEQVYDSFLKGNGQELGMRSYGACVDLLAAYFGGEQV